MAPKINDPSSFLNSIVSKKGKSDLYGVCLTGVSVLADARENYDYDVSLSAVESDLDYTIAAERNDWNNLLVETRQDVDQIVHPISFLRQREPHTVFFIVEGQEMSCLVFIPSLVVSEFPEDVVFFQQLLNYVASFAGKTPTTIRFTIGCATMVWKDLVTRGEAKEVEVEVGW